MSSMECRICGKLKKADQFSHNRRKCKRCLADRALENYRANRDEINRRRRERYDAEARSIYAKQLRPKYSERISAYAHRYWETNKTAAKAQHALWVSRNRTRVRFHCQQRRMRRRGAPVIDFTVEQWEQMKADFQGCCAYCGCKPDRLTQDHVLPLSRGGAHTAANILPACSSCNSRKNKRTPEEAGMTIEGRHTP